MSSNDFKPATKVAFDGISTQSFGAHRQSDRPASAIRAGANTMPAAWQARSVSDRNDHDQYDASVRSIGEIITDPFRKAVATPPRKIAVAVLVTGCTLAILF